MIRDSFFMYEILIVCTISLLNLLSCLVTERLKLIVSPFPNFEAGLCYSFVMPDTKIYHKIYLLVRYQICVEATKKNVVCKITGDT